MYFINLKIVFVLFIVVRSVLVYCRGNDIIGGGKKNFKYEGYDISKEDELKRN